MTAAANRVGRLRPRVRQRLCQPAQFGAQRVPLGGQLADPVVVAVQLGAAARHPARPRPARRRCPAPYLRVSAVSAARRSSTAASRSGSASRSSAYPASSPATSPSRMPISPIRSASAASAGSCDRTASSARWAPATSVVGVDALRVLGVARQRGVRERWRRRPAPRRGRAAPPPPPARRPRRRAARRRRSRRGRSAAGRLPGPAPARAWSSRPARRRRPAAAGRRPRTWRAARRPRRPRTGRGPAAAGPACSSPCWSVWPCTATSSSASSASTPTGTERPPRCARERPSAETVRLISSAPSSSSAPGLLGPHGGRRARGHA